MWRAMGSGDLAGDAAQPAHTAPSWADLQHSATPPHPERSLSWLRKRSSNRYVKLTLLVALTLGIFLAPLFAPRGTTLPLWVLFAWIAAIAVVTLLFVRQARRHGGPARPAESVPEQALTWTSVCIGFVAVYGVWTRHGPVPLWFWGCATALVAILSIAALNAAPRDVRARVRVAVYGGIMAVVVLLPLDALPRPARLPVAGLRTEIIIVMVVLMQIDGRRVRRAASVAESSRVRHGVSGLP